MLLCFFFFLVYLTEKSTFHFGCRIRFFCGLFPTICNAFDLMEQRCSLREGWELSHMSAQAETLDQLGNLEKLDQQQRAIEVGGTFVFVSFAPASAPSPVTLKSWKNCKICRASVDEHLSLF